MKILLRHEYQKEKEKHTEYVIVFISIPSIKEHAYDTIKNSEDATYVSVIGILVVLKSYKSITEDSEPFVG